MWQHLIAQIYILLLGFSLGGLAVSAYQALSGEMLSLRILGAPPLQALAGSALIAFSAPFLIMRRTVTGPATFASAMAATLFAGLWSLACGTLILRMTGLFI